LRLGFYDENPQGARERKGKGKNGVQGKRTSDTEKSAQNRKNEASGRGEVSGQNTPYEEVWEARDKNESLGRRVQ